MTLICNTLVTRAIYDLLDYISPNIFFTVLLYPFFHCAKNKKQILKNKKDNSAKLLKQK